MLSVLIPVYNFDIRPLVQDLQKQCLQIGAPFEIRCLDDCSQKGFQQLNREISKLEGVVYEELESNVGRSQIRNRLAKSANFDYLLFMDCDSKVVRSDYIARYVQHLSEDTLLYGGRVYDENPPVSPDLYFHWLYGISREQIFVERRRSTPYHAFMTNNFLVPKALFLSIQFDERLTQYGHEDTIFGLELRQRNIPILHLDNPLEHLGLETVDVFLEKTKRGIANLHFLWKENPLIDTRLLRMAKKLKQWKLQTFVKWTLDLFYPMIWKNLHSARPKMRYFDFFKLLLLLKKESSKRKNPPSTLTPSRNEK